MKLSPEIKQLRKENRLLKKDLENKTIEISELKTKIKDNRIFLFKYFIEPLTSVILSPREQKLIKMRFGFIDGVAHTLEEAGQEFDVTRERIRQFEAKALERIRKFIYLATQPNNLKQNDYQQRLS